MKQKEAEEERVQQADANERAGAKQSPGLMMATGIVVAANGFQNDPNNGASNKVNYGMGLRA